MHTNETGITGAYIKMQLAYIV